MRVLMLAVNFLKIPYPVYPLGAGTAAALAREAGHEVKFLDLLSDSRFLGYQPERLKAIVRDFKPDCVGLSLRNLESADSTNADDCWSLGLISRLVQDIRAVSPAPQVLGGAGFSLMPDTILKHSGADYGLAGEGERILPAFLQALGQGDAPKGLWATAEPGPTQKSAYDPNLVRAYDQAGGLIGVQTKRGCPLNCAYCSYPLLEGRRVRVRPVKEVMEDLSLLADILPEPHIAFADAVFNDPGGSWLELLEAVVTSGLKIKWTGFFQPARLDKDGLDLVRASGVSGLEFGTDGATDAALKGLNKPFDFALVRDLQNRCLAAGVPTAHYFIFGGPGETEATVDEGIKNITEIKGCAAFISSGLSSYPRTPLHQSALKEGLVAPDDDLSRPVFYYSPHIRPQWLNSRLEQAFGRSRHILFPPGRAQEKTDILRRMGFKGILWDTLIKYSRADETNRRAGNNA